MRKTSKLKSLIEDVVPQTTYTVQLEPMDSQAMPFMITQPEFMRRMKEMQQTGGGGMFGNMPEMYNLIVNVNHPLVSQILETKTKKKQDRLIKQSVDLITKPKSVERGRTHFLYQSSFELIK